MTSARIPIDNGEWKRLGLRRLSMLAILLMINLLLIIAGVDIHLDRAGAAVAAMPANDTPHQPDAADTAQDVMAELHEAELHEYAPPEAAVSETTIGPETQPEAGRPLAKPVEAIAPQPSVPTASNRTEESHPRGPSNTDSANTAIVVAGTSDLPIETLDDSSRSLTLINPPGTRGIIHYMIAGVVHSLSPGEYHRLEGEMPRQIKFHQGDDLGDTELAISNGVFVFNVSDNGWKLTERPADTVGRLLRVCRPSQTEK